MQVFDGAKIKKMIDKYGISSQYLKACQNIENGYYKTVDLKLRKPKN